jgi:hypothetical protein
VVVVAYRIHLQLQLVDSKEPVVMHIVEGIVGMLLLVLHIAGCCCLQRLAG